MKINAKSIEGLKMLSKGLNLFIEGLVEESMNTDFEVVATSDTIAESTPVQDIVPVSAETADDEDGEEANSDIAEVVEEKEESVSAKEGNGITEEELSEMSYNNLKKYAKELGLSATGTRAELVKKILSVNADSSDEEEPEDVLEETEDSIADEEPVEVSEEEEPEEDALEENEPDDEDEEEEDPIVAQVNEAVEDMEDSEIRELLESVDISPKGKRQALISKLILAVQDGIIEFDSDEDEETTADDSSEEEEPKENASEETELVSNDVTKDMTPPRRKTFDNFCKETTEAFENEDILREDLIEFINDFNGTSDKMKKVSDEDLLAQYLELSAMLVSDDGEIVEEGAYYVNDEPYCCGHPLVYNKKKKVYRCELCGEEYEVE